MHLSYLPENPKFDAADENAIVERIRQRRGPGGLWTLDRTTLHSPVFADAFNNFVGTIRSKTTVQADLRETAFLRVAALTNCWYEWEIHNPIANEAGVSKEAIDHGILYGGEENWRGLTEQQRIVAEYTDLVTNSGCCVDGFLVKKLKDFLSEKQVVELTGIIAGFNMVTRFIGGLNVGEQNGVSGWLDKLA
jgi:alkylhydroperoxidase family enzyme